MINCRESTRLLSEAMEQPLGSKQRLGLWLHTLMCSGCRRFGRQLHALRNLSRIYVSHVPPTEAGPPGADADK